jgi:hypothetical protein
VELCVHVEAGAAPLSSGRANSSMCMRNPNVTEIQRPSDLQHVESPYKDDSRCSAAMMGPAVPLTSPLLSLQGVHHCQHPVH